MGSPLFQCPGMCFYTDPAIPSSRRRTPLPNWEVVSSDTFPNILPSPKAKRDRFWEDNLSEPETTSRGLLQTTWDCGWYKKGWMEEWRSCYATQSRFTMVLSSTVHKRFWGSQYHWTMWGPRTMRPEGESQINPDGLRSHWELYY